eukprot:488964_1
MDNDKQNTKLNANNVYIKLHKLHQSNQTLQNQNNKLTQERDHYKHGCNLYKNQFNKWKSKYITLYSQIRDITTTNSDKPDNAMVNRQPLSNKNSQSYAYQMPEPTDSDNDTFDMENGEMDINECINDNILSDNTNSYSETVSLKLQFVFPKLQLSNQEYDFETCMINITNNNGMNNCCKPEMLAPLHITRRKGGGYDNLLLIDDEYVECNGCTEVYEL